MRDLANAVQPSTCNTYKAIEQANSSRPHLDVTGIGATACCHGFFVPTSVVDFQKGERFVQSIETYQVGNNLPPPPGRSTWTIAFARPSHTTWKTFLWPWSCMTSCANMEFTSKSEWKEVQSYLSQSPWNSALALACSIFMATRIHACLAFHPATYQGRSRWMVKSSRPYGHHSITSLGASAGCPLLIDKRYWMPI
jgi:hypothetical protein